MALFEILLGGLLILGHAGSARASAGLQNEIDRQVQHAFALAKLRQPQVDSKLTQVARALANKALDEGAHEATAAKSIADELARAGIWDPPPRAIAVRASPVDRAMQAIAGRNDLACTPASHFGSAVVVSGGAAAIVLLFVERKAMLEPFPRLVGIGEQVSLAGRLVFPLADARIYVTDPSGLSRLIPGKHQNRDQFRANLNFAKSGIYTVEVVAQSVQGPQVVALFKVQAGRNANQSPERAGMRPEQDDLGKAETQVLAAINRLRQAHGLKPVIRNSLLDSVAAAHCREMVKLNYFAHVSPFSGDVAQRVTKAGFRYQRVSENLGEASSALEAHQLIEGSPSHLANVLDPNVDLAGISAAQVKRGSMDNVLITEIFARPAKSAEATP